MRWIIFYYQLVWSNDLMRLFGNTLGLEGYFADIFFMRLSTSFVKYSTNFSTLRQYLIISTSKSVNLIDTFLNDNSRAYSEDGTSCLK